MNVEQLIEDGIKANAEKFDLMRWGDDCKCAGEEGFSLGVRHALAAMFPVVKGEEINFPEMDEQRIYAKKPDEDVWRLVELNWDTEECVMYLSSCWWGKDRTVFEAEEEGIEIRRCPTPGEMGMGGVA